MQLKNNVRSREVPVTVQPWMRLARRAVMIRPLPLDSQHSQTLNSAHVTSTTC